MINNRDKSAELSELIKDNEAYGLLRNHPTVIRLFEKLKNPDRAPKEIKEKKTTNNQYEIKGFVHIYIGGIPPHFSSRKNLIEELPKHIFNELLKDEGCIFYILNRSN